MTAATRPLVKKMGGAWIWRCEHSPAAGGQVGDEFFEDRWRDAWCAAYAAAVRHAAAFHDQSKGETA